MGTILGIFVSLFLGFLFGWWLVIVLPLKQQITSLRASIRKWEAIVYNGAIDGRGTDCDLCIQYRTYHPETCGGCPVYEFTSVPDCLQTPYMDWANTFDYGDDFKVTNADQLAAAKNELQFLKQLLNTLERKKWWNFNVSKT